MFNNCIYSSATRTCLFVVFVFLSGQFALADFTINVATIGDSVGANRQNRNTARTSIRDAGAEVNFIGNDGYTTLSTFSRAGTTFRQMHLGLEGFNHPGFVEYQAGYSDVTFDTVVIFGGYNDAVREYADSDMVQNALDLRLLIEDINAKWDVGTIAVVKLYDLNFDNDPTQQTNWELKQGNVDRLNSHIDQLALDIANVETIEINEYLEPSDYRSDGLHLNSNGQIVAGKQIAQALLKFEASILGDVNRDGSVNFLDINPFVSALFSALFIGEFRPEADISQDIQVNFLDIRPFVELLFGQ